MLSTGFPSCQYCLRTRRYCKRNPLYDWDKLSSVQNPIGGRNDPGAYRASPYSDPLVFSEILAPARILQSAAHSISSEPRDFPTTRPELSTHANPNSDLHLQNTLHQDKNEQTSEFAMPKGRAREVNLDRTSDTTPQSTAAKVTGCDKCIREGKQCISAANNIERQGQCTNCQKAGKTVECSRYQLSTFACLHCHRRHYTCRTERGFKRCVLCEKKGHACVEGTRKQADTIWVFAKNEASRNNTTQDEEFSKIVFDPTRRLTYDIDDLDSNLGTSPMAAPPNKKRKQNNGQTSNSMAGPSLPKAAQRPAQVRNLAAMNNESDDTIADPPTLAPAAHPDWHDGRYTGEWPEFEPTVPPFEEWYNNHTKPYQMYEPSPDDEPYEPVGLPGKPGFKWNHKTKLFDRFTDELVGYKLNALGKFDKIADEVPGYVFNLKTKYFEKIVEEPESMVIDPPESSTSEPPQDKGKGKEVAIEEEFEPTDDTLLYDTFNEPELPKLLCCNNCKLRNECKIETEGAHILHHIFTTGNNYPVFESHIPHPSAEWNKNPLYVSISEDFEPFGIPYSDKNYNLEIFSVHDLHQGYLVKVTPTGSRDRWTSKPPVCTAADANSKSPNDKLVILPGVIDLICEEHSRAWNIKFLTYMEEGARFKKGEEAAYRYIFGDD